MIHSIKVNKFRLFENVGFNLGRYVTVIGGQNATGKSTLLGMLGHSSELKKKEGLPILGDQFRTEFSEIFKASEKHDCTGSNLYEVCFSSIENPNEIEFIADFRATWQESGERYRLIPKRPGNSKKGTTEAKVKSPSLYLGLSRLFPIGEIQQKIHIKSPDLTPTEEEWMLEQYSNILASHDEIDSFMGLDTAIKMGFGISTSRYDYLVNSSGEDNLGQILLALLSFRRLKESISFDYPGGLLLIDEIDATLHPSVQIKLYQLLIKCAKELDLQIVFTTHSMTLLEHVSIQCEYNSSSSINNIELVYLTTANIKLEIIANPPLRQIKYDLLNSSSTLIKYPKIIVYSEDCEARWFLSKLIPQYIDKLLLLDIKIGYSNLLDLRKQDANYFSTVLFVLDGDVPLEKINDYNNILLLPGFDNPEQVIHGYLKNLTNNPEHEIWNMPISRNNGFTIRYFDTHGPGTYTGKPREQYKAWFNKELPLFEQLGVFDCWKAEHKEQVTKFTSNFIDTYNAIAKINSIPRIM